MRSSPTAVPLSKNRESRGTTLFSGHHRSPQACPTLQSRNLEPQQTKASASPTETFSSREENPNAHISDKHATILIHHPPDQASNEDSSNKRHLHRHLSIGYERLALQEGLADNQASPSGLSRELSPSGSKSIDGSKDTF